jgi:hypothetical protein
MKALIGVDPHKATVAVAAVDEVLGELVECATFLHNRAGLRALERWAKRFPERRWAVVDVAPKLSARVLVLSTGNARKNDGLDVLPTALWPPGATSGCLPSIPRPGRKCCACFPKDAISPEAGSPRTTKRSAPRSPGSPTVGARFAVGRRQRSLSPRCGRRLTPITTTEAVTFRVRLGHIGGVEVRLVG